MKGTFITLYGINNIGKTTHAKLLAKRLCDEGYDAIYIKYPRYDIEPTGPFLNKTLRMSKRGQRISEEELQMWFTLNRYQFQPTLEKWLEDGRIVIAEDYIGTGIGWGAAKGAKIPWLESLNSHLRREDFGLLLEGQRALHAKEKGHIHEENDVLVEKTRRIFLSLGHKYRWQRVRLAAEKHVSAERVYSVVKKFLTSR